MILRTILFLIILFVAGCNKPKSYFIKPSDRDYHLGMGRFMIIDNEIEQTLDAELGNGNSVYFHLIAKNNITGEKSWVIGNANWVKSYIYKDKIIDEYKYFDSLQKCEIKIQTNFEEFKTAKILSNCPEKYSFKAMKIEIEKTK